jgi:hypothetical protein
MIPIGSSSLPGRATSFLVAGASATPYVASLPAGSYSTATQFAFSNWGIGVLTDQSGYDPTKIWTAPLNSTGSSLIQTALGDQNWLTLNDAGDATWLARNTFSTPDNLLYTWSAAQGVTQLPTPPATSFYGYEVAGTTDPSGHITVVYPNAQFGTQMLGTYNGAAWTTTPLNAYPYGEWTNNPSGQVLFMNSGSNYELTLLNGSTLVPLAYSGSTSGISSGEFQHFDSLADNGAALTVVYNEYLSMPWQATLTQSNGASLSLQTLLDSGNLSTYNGDDYAMNFAGDLLISRLDTSTGLYCYYSYDGTTFTPMLLEVPKLIDPTLTNDGSLYYVTDANGFYSLDVATVPEPANLALFTCCAVTGLAVLKHRPSRHLVPSAFSPL